MTTQGMLPKDCILATGRLRYWDGGPEQAPVVLLLHSAFSDAEFSWSSIWDVLAAQHRVIAPDMPGFSASQAPKGMSLAVLARALRELLSQLGVTRATVVGNSFGVSAAISLASLYPECVERLVLVNGTTLPPVPGLLKWAVAAIPAVDRAISRMFFGVGYSAKAIRDCFPHASPEELSLIEARVARDGAACGETVKGYVLNSVARRPSVTAPVTLLWGADDRLAPLKVARDLSRMLPGAQLVTIEHAGHLPQRDQPQEFVAQLLHAMG